MELAELVRCKRVDLKLSQKALGAKLGYPDGQAVSNFERGAGSLPLKRLKKLKKALDIPEKTIKELIVKDFLAELSKAFDKKK